MKSLKLGVTIAINLDIHVKPVGSFMKNLLIGKVVSKGREIPSYAPQKQMLVILNLFSKEQIDQILKLLKTTSSSNPSVFLAQSGKFPQALSYINSSPWIIDSGASDHMTSSFSFFASYAPIYCNRKIRTADGSFTSIIGKGTIPSTTKLSCILSFMFACNLLSVSKVSKYTNCRVVFCVT